MILAEPNSKKTPLRLRWSVILKGTSSYHWVRLELQLKQFGSMVSLHFHTAHFSAAISFLFHVTLSIFTNEAGIKTENASVFANTTRWL